MSDYQHLKKRYTFRGDSNESRKPMKIVSGDAVQHLHSNTLQTK
jgi:hypothetical protein